MAERERNFGQVMREVENAKDWEWSDCVRWLSNLSQSLAPCPRLLCLLAKRLQQFLQPSFPEVVRAEALKVYRGAIELVTNECTLLPLFVAPLYAFFTYAKADSQAEVISIFKEFVFERKTLVSASMDSLLISLSMGLDYSGLSEQITDYLRKIRPNNELEFDESLWKAMLKAPAIRVSALELFSLLCQGGDRRADPLAVNALATTLKEDNNDDVLKLVMTVVQQQFPVHTPRISVQHQRQLFSGMLHQLSRRQEEISKSIVQYLLPGLNNKTKMQHLVVPVLMEEFEIMKMSEKSCLKSFEKLESLMEVKDLRELRTCVMQGFIFHFLTYVRTLFEYTSYGERVRMKAGLLLNSLEDISHIVWDSIFQQIRESFGCADYQGLPVLLFALESYQVPKQAEGAVVATAEEIAHRMKSLSADDYRLALCILKSMSNCYEHGFEFSPSFLAVCDSILSEVFLHKPEYAEIAMDWQCYLHAGNPEESFEQSVTVLVSYVSSYKMEDQKLLARLLEKGSEGLENIISKRLGSSLEFSVFRQLWEMTPKPGGRLLLSMACSRPDQFSEFLSQELNKDDATVGVQRFAEIWHLAVCEEQLSLPTLFESRPSLIRVLALLNSSNYLTRQEAIYWFSTSLSHVEVVINTLAGLLKSPEKCAEGLIYCENVLRTGGEAFVLTITTGENRDLQLAQRLVHPLLGLIELGETQSHGFAVPVAACHCLYLLLSHKNVPLAMYCFTLVLKLLEQCRVHEHYLVLEELIEIVRLLALKSDLDQHPVDLRPKIASLEFEKVYLQRIQRSDELLWGRWMKFHIDTFPLVLALVRPSLLVNITLELIKYYLSALPEAPESFKALETIISGSLKLLDLPNFVAEHGELITTSYTNLFANQVSRETFDSNAVRCIVLRRTESKTGYLFGDFLVAVVLELENVLSTVAGGLKVTMNELDLTNMGVKMFEGVWRGDVGKDPYSLSVKALLFPFAKSFPEVFFSLCIHLWNSNYSNYSTGGELMYHRVIQLLQLVEFTSQEAVDAANFFLEMGLEIKSELNSQHKKMAIGMCHLLYTFLSVTPSSRFSQVHLQSPLISSISNLLTLLAKAESREANLWQLHFLDLACVRLKIGESPETNAVQTETLQKHYERLFEEEILQICTDNGSLLDLPYPPAIYIKQMDDVQVQVGSLYTLIATLSDSTVLFANSRQRLLELFEREGKRLLTTFLSSNKHSSELVSQLCLNLAVCAKSDLQMTPVIMDFLQSGRIWTVLAQESAQQTMNKWTNFAKIVTEFGYENSTERLVNTVLDISVGYLASKAVEIRMRDNTIKLLSFLIYYAEISFEDAMDLIVEKFIEYLRLHEGSYIPACFLLLRVLMLKIGKNTVDEEIVKLYGTLREDWRRYWMRLWPHVLVELILLLKNSNISLLHRWAALKLVEFQFAIRNEDFLKHLWIFTYNTDDLRNVTRYQLEPVIVRAFKQSETQPRHRTVSLNLLQSASTPVGTLYQVPETEEELAQSARELSAQVLKFVSSLPEIDSQMLRQAIEQDIRML